MKFQLIKNSFLLICIFSIFSCGRKNSSIILSPKLQTELQQPTLPYEQSIPEGSNPADGQTTILPQTSNEIPEETSLKSDLLKLEPLKWENPDLWPSSNARQKAIKKTYSPLAKSWSEIVYSTIKNKTPELLRDQPASDIANFCTRYSNLTENQRLIFWAYFFVSLAYEESGWNPTSVNFERREGYTKSASEGLFQLSHPDAESHQLDCGFDWNVDKNLVPNDPKKTILNPLLNLTCGIQILSRELDKKHRIQVQNDRPDLVYWAVLYNGKSAKALASIKKSTQSLRFCK